MLHKQENKWLGHTTDLPVKGDVKDENSEIIKLKNMFKCFFLCLYLCINVEIASPGTKFSKSI